MGVFNNCITKNLEKSTLGLNLYAIASGFTCYFCMYAFRKPFTSAEYKGLKIFKIDFKIFALTLQVCGYAISKFLGIKYVSEMNKNKRGLTIIITITIAEIFLVFFGFIPPPYNSFAMFFNGLPLGVIWGVCFSFIEGRKTSSVLGCGMCVSFIISSGMVKSVGLYLMQKGIAVWWMPSLVGAIFYPILLLSVFMLESLPEPTEEDLLQKTERVRLNGKERIAIIKQFFPGILSMILFHMVLTGYRDFRDNFAAELWSDFKYKKTPAIFSKSEIIVAFIVLFIIGSLMLIKSNFNIFVAYHILIILGMIMMFIFTILFQKELINGLVFMIITGVGLNIGYVIFNNIIFEALLSTYHYKGNSGFFTYMCDSFGYLTSVGILFVKNFLTPSLKWSIFYIKITYFLSIGGAILIILSLIYYSWKFIHWNFEDSKIQDNELEKIDTISSNDDDDSCINKEI